MIKVGRQQMNNHKQRKNTTQRIDKRDDDTDSKSTKQDSLRLLGNVQDLDKNWMVQKLDDKGSFLALKRAKDTLEVKYSLTVSEDFQKYLKLVADTQSYVHLLPFCKSSVQIKADSPLNKTILLNFGTPLIGDRHLLVKVKAHQEIQKQGRIFLFGQGVPESQAKPLLSGNKIKGSYMPLNMFANSSTEVEGGIQLKAYAKLDSNFSLIPDFIIRQLLKLIGSFLKDQFSQVVSQSQKLDKQGESRSDVEKCIEAKVKIFHRPKL